MSLGLATSVSCFVMRAAWTFAAESLTLDLARAFQPQIHHSLKQLATLLTRAVFAVAQAGRFEAQMKRRGADRRLFGQKLA